MYTDEDIDSAVAAGALTAEAAAAFRAHVAKQKDESAVDEEHFRLVGGFNDIFVVIACLLLLASLAWLGGELTPWLGAVAVAAAAWFLGEFFIRKRRMALPAIILLLAFVGGVLAGGIHLFGEGEKTYLAASLIAAAAAWLHWLRFQVPITVAAGTAVAVSGIVALMFWLIPESKDWLSAISLTSGSVALLLAMRWDATDTARVTRRSDAAFWLHLLAAPLLVHPVFYSLGMFEGETTLWQAVAVIALYVVIAFVSLCIDRRALMVSALVYVLYTFSALLKQYGVVSLGFAITALVIGSSLLLLSAYWHPSRTFALRFVPPAVRKWLAPVR